MAGNRVTRKDRATEAPPGTGLALDFWMTKLGVADDDLAQKLNVSRISVWRWRRGRRQPKKFLIPRIAAALGLTPADLWRVAETISLDEAAVHITNPKDRARFAKLLRNHPPS